MKEDKNKNQFIREQKILGAVRFLAFPLGMVMYEVTERPFGETVAIILSVIAAASFWMIIMKGKDKSLYDALAEKIHEAIDLVGHIDHQIEMKSVGGGLILRVFLLNPGEKIDLYDKSIYRALSNWDISKRAWVVQISPVMAYSDIDRVRSTLDQELLEEIEKAKKEKRDLFSNNKDKK